MISRSVLPFFLAVVLVGLPISAANQSLFFDDFPMALANYITGGWRGPFGDGTGGTISPTGDQMGVFLDGTVNAAAYAIRRYPNLTNGNLTVVFAALNGDPTPADSFGLYLAWRNSTYPGQLSCPPCLFPTPQTGIEVNFNIGQGIVQVLEWTNSVGSEVANASSALSQGAVHEARVEYISGKVSVYLDSVQEIVVTNLLKPAGSVGFIAYRIDVAIDSLRFELPQSTSSGSGNPSVSEVSPWIVALIAGAVGGGVVFLASTILAWTKRPRIGTR